MSARHKHARRITPLVGGVTAAMLALLAACGERLPYTPDEVREIEQANRDVEPVYGVSIVKEYMADREAANEKYQGRVVSVYGGLALVATGYADGTDAAIEGYETPLAPNEAPYVELRSAAARWPLNLPQHFAPRLRCYFSSRHASESTELEDLRRFIDDPFTVIVLLGTVNEQDDRVPHVIEVLGCRYMYRVIHD